MQDSELLEVDIFEWYFGFCLQVQIQNSKNVLNEDEIGKMFLFNHFQHAVTEPNTSKLCDSMKTELSESITEREMACIQINLQ